MFKLRSGVDFLLKKAKVDIVSGEASFKDKNTTRIFRFEHETRLDF